MQNEINELRNQIRTLKRVLYTLCGAGVLGGLLAATNPNSVPDVIQAKKFEVVNDEGKVVASLFADADGGRLSVLNKDQKIVAGIYATAVGGLLGVYNKDGKPVAGLSATTEQGGLLSILNKDGKPVAAVRVDADGDGAVVTQNGKGQMTSHTP